MGAILFGISVLEKELQWKITDLFTAWGLLHKSGIQISRMIDKASLDKV